MRIKTKEMANKFKKIEADKLIELNHFAEFGRLSSGFFYEFINFLTSISLNMEQVQLKKEIKYENLYQNFTAPLL